MNNKNTYIGYLKVKNGGIKIIPGEKDNKIISNRDKILNHLNLVLSGGTKLKEKYIEKYFKALEGKYVRGNINNIHGGSEQIFKDTDKLIKLTLKRNIPIQNTLNLLKGSGSELYSKLESRLHNKYGGINNSRYSGGVRYSESDRYSGGRGRYSEGGRRYSESERYYGGESERYYGGESERYYGGESERYYGGEGERYYGGEDKIVPVVPPNLPQGETVDIESTNLPEEKYQLPVFKNGNGILLKFIQNENTKNWPTRIRDENLETSIQSKIINELFNPKKWDLFNPSTWVYRDIIDWIKKRNVKFRDMKNVVDNKYGSYLGTIMGGLLNYNSPFSYNLRSFLVFQYFNHNSSVPDKYNYINVKNTAGKLNLEIIILWWTLELSFALYQGEQYVRCQSTYKCNKECDADVKALIQIAIALKTMLKKSEPSILEKIKKFLDGVYYAILWNSNLSIPEEYMNDIWTGKQQCEPRGGYDNYRYSEGGRRYSDGGRYSEGGRYYDDDDDDDR
jgi:hypothetical protein